MALAARNKQHKAVVGAAEVGCNRMNLVCPNEVCR